MYTSDDNSGRTSRRRLLTAAVAASVVPAWAAPRRAVPHRSGPAQIAISLDLEMSAQYPRRDITEWNYEKGNLDDDTKRYAVEAGRVAKRLGGLIHYFCVGRVLEQPSVDWLSELSAAGHPIGNHTYDHVNVLAMTPPETQFRFQRAPWLVQGLTAHEIIDRNVRMATAAMKSRLGIEPAGFRTPGGFARGLQDRPDVQQLLLDAGFSWVSSKYPPHSSGKPKEEPTEDVYDSIVNAQSMAQPFRYPSGLIEVPMSPISDVSAFRTNYWKLDYFLHAIRKAVEWAIESGGIFDFLGHPSCLVVEDPKFETIKLICDLARAAGQKALLVSLGTIARSLA